MTLLWALAGCLDRMLEAPWVLTSGIGEARSLAPDGTGAWLVATDRGVARIDGEGKASDVEAGAADAVSTHPGRVYVLRDGVVRWPGGEARVDGAIDVAGGWDALWVLTPDTLWAVDPATGEKTARATGLDGARAVALGPEPEALVVTRDAVVAIGPGGGARALATGLVGPRAACTDARGRVFVAAGEDPALWRLDAAGPVLAARYLGDVRDLHVGLGGLLPAENLYLAVGTGSIDYLRPS